MNRFELFFIAVSFGGGIGLGASMAKQYGVLGFFGGFSVVVISSLGLLAVVRVVLSKKRSRQERRNEQSKKRIEQGVERLRLAEWSVGQDQRNTL